MSMSCIYIALSQSSLTTQSTFTLQILHSDILMHTGGIDYLTQGHLLIRSINHSYTLTLMAQHQEQFRVQCLAQGCLEIVTESAQYVQAKVRGHII